MKKNVLYVYYSPVFAERDEKLLENSFNVDMQYYSDVKYKSIVGKVRYIFDTFLKVFHTDAIVFMMGGSHLWFPMLFAKILGKKTLVVLGGSDSQSIPSLKYGMFYKKGLKSKINGLMYRWASMLAPVDKSLISSVNKYADPNGVGFKVGVKELVPKLKTPYVVIPTEYDEDFWTVNNVCRQGIITVAVVNDLDTMRLKGVDLFLELANKFPDTRFTLVGISKDLQKKLEVPNNVTCHEFVSVSDLIELYNYHKIYLLPSMSEGLPNVLCEAMLCGCLPVSSDVGGCKKVVGDTGYVIEQNNIENWINALDKAIHDETYQPNQYREKIKNNLGKGTRKELLVATLEDIIML